MAQGFAILDRPDASGSREVVFTSGREPRRTWFSYPALKNPRFVRILIGDVVSGLGNSGYILAPFFFIYQLTAEVGPIAGLWAARVLARLLLQPLAGALVDRWDRRQTVILANLASAGAVCLFPRADVYRLYLFFILTAVVQGTNDCLAPAFNAWIPAVLAGPEHFSANARFQAGSGAGVSSARR